MTNHRVLVLGGGFGGIATAVALREQLDARDEVVLVERRPTFVMGLRKSWAILDAGALEAGERPLSRLADRGIEVVEGTVQGIHPGERAADVDGKRWEADAIVVALGASRDPGAIPGFADHAIDVYDGDQVDRAREAVDGVEAGQRVVIGVFGAPYPCPPAPFELALLVDERLRARGIEGAVEVFSPLPLSLPILGQAGCSTFESRLEAGGIAFLRSHAAAAVEPDRVTFIASAEGAAPPPGRPFDVLLGIPPHRVPEVVRQSGLTDGKPWIAVAPRTLETAWPGVYAIGDVTALPLANGMMLPKAGLMAQREGEAVAARIAQSLRGEAPTATFAGDGACFLEVAGGMAAQVEGGFLADPPKVTMTEPSAEHLASKHAFERDRLEAWFGN